jgi:hypothetical protein
LAREAAKAMLDDFTVRVEVHTARQDEPGTTLHLGVSPDTGKRPRRLASRRAPRQRTAAQQALPGLDDVG